MTRTEPTPDGRTWILWDGECGFCRRAVGWVKARDSRDALYLTPYQAVPSPPMTHEWRAACEKAVHIILPDGQVLRAGRACLRVLETIGWGRVAWVLGLPPLLWAVELGYRMVAANRDFFSHLFFRHETGKVG